MHRIVRVTLDVVGLRYPDPNYAIVVGQQLRTAKWQEVCDVNTGESVREGDLALPLQIVEDVFSSAVSRTVGIARQLVF